MKDITVIMPNLPKGRRKKTPRSKSQYKKDGSVNFKARIAFYDHSPEYRTLYQTERWQKMRHKALSKDPVCPICLHRGQVVPATDVDHVFPHRGNPGDFYDMDNIWCLDQACHMKKTALESNGKEYRTKQEWLDAILPLYD